MRVKQQQQRQPKKKNKFEAYIYRPFVWNEIKLSVKLLMCLNWKQNKKKNTAITWKKKSTLRKYILANGHNQPNWMWSRREKWRKANWLIQVPFVTNQMV